MKEFLKKNKNLFDWFFRLLNLLLTIGIPTIIIYLLSLIKSVNTFIINNQGLIILLILLICFIIIWQQIQLRKIIKSMIIEEYNIISDEETIFEYSDKYRNLPTNVQSSLASGTDFWSFSSNYYNDLKNSKWIAHDKYVTNDEAINGGDYHFKKIFKLPIDLKKILSAEINFVVDDTCTLILNTKMICSKVIGQTKLHSYNITKDIIKDDNELRLIIENVSFKEHLGNQPNHPFWKKNDKYLDNPYGVRYCITIKYKK